jgi:uncharacterized iron-regulated protein
MREMKLKALKYKGYAGRAVTLNACIAMLAAFIFIAGCGTGKLIRVADRTVVEPPGLAEELRGAEIVFVGEHHDDRLHHKKQLMVIQALHEAGVDVAVGLEMYHAERQEELDRWVEGNVSEREMKKLFAKNWGMPFSKYKSIFRFARDEGIPLVGLNISNKVIHRIFSEGFGSLSAEELSRMPGAHCDVDERYEAFIREAMGEHDHGKHGKDGEAPEGPAEDDVDDVDAAAPKVDTDDSLSGDPGDDLGVGTAAPDGAGKGKDSEQESPEDKIFKRFCEAQVAWDATMAFHSVEYLRKNPGYTLVVLSGSAHSWKRGIPRQVRGQSAYTFQVIIPESSERLSIKNVTQDDADYLWLDPW